MLSITQSAAASTCTLEAAWREEPPPCAWGAAMRAESSLRLPKARGQSDCKIKRKVENGLRDMTEYSAVDTCSGEVPQLGAECTFCGPVMRAVWGADRWRPGGCLGRPAPTSNLGLLASDHDPNRTKPFCLLYPRHGALDSSDWPFSAQRCICLFLHLTHRNCLINRLRPHHHWAQTASNPTLFKVTL